MFERKRHGRRPGSVLVAGCAALVVTVFVAACSGTPAPPTPFPSLQPGSVLITAHNTAYTPPDVTVPANSAWILALDNEDNLPHNVVITGADGQTIFASDVYTGPGVHSQPAPALAPGSYAFSCAVHQGMKGKITAA